MGKVPLKASITNGKKAGNIHAAVNAQQVGLLCNVRLLGHTHFLVNYAMAKKPYQLYLKEVEELPEKPPINFILKKHTD